jgi:mRNA interferase MazF
MVNLNPVVGHEQGERRPCLVISHDRLNHGPAELTIVIPITSTPRGIPYHVPVNPPEGGLTNTSYVMCEMIRSVSSGRLVERRGAVRRTTLQQVEAQLIPLLNFSLPEHQRP